MLNLSAVLIAKNAADKIGDALESTENLADEVIVLDGGSTDGTVDLAKKHKARVVKQKGKGYSAWRNQGLKEVKGKWVFYLDTDERVTPELAQEIRQIIEAGPAPGFPPASARRKAARVSGALPPVSPASQLAVYAIPRRNIILGWEMRHGGWWPDYVKRLFRKDVLKGWKGELHEEPIFQGELGHLENPMVHQKHDNLSEMVEKTNKWSAIEARLLFESGHPKMSWWRFIRVMAGELWYRLIVKAGFLDGTAGVVYAIYQMWSKFVTYGKLWEMQRRR